MTNNVLKDYYPVSVWTGAWDSIDSDFQGWVRGITCLFQTTLQKAIKQGEDTLGTPIRAGVG